LNGTDEPHHQILAQRDRDSVSANKLRFLAYEVIESMTAHGLRARDFDNSEMVQAARNSLHRMFVELANQSKVWELSPAELERLSNINLRPTK
jgi:hypothetical protein